MADAKLTALSLIGSPALSDLFYGVRNPGGTAASIKFDGARALGLGGFLPGGRLSLTTGTPVTTTDVTAAGTLYYTPYRTNLIRIYDGTQWQLYTFSERSLSLTLTSGKNYDVFIYDNAGTLTLELSAAWTNDTTRADALTTQDGINVKSGATTRLHLGTIRASGANQTEDSFGGAHQSGGKRFVWNRYNQEPRALGVIDTTDSWSYSTDTIRQADGAAGNKVEYVTGDAAMLVQASIYAVGALGSNSARAAKVGVGVDSTTTFSGLAQAGYVTGGTTYTAFGASYKGYPGLGYHYISWNEKGADGTSIFNGDNAADSQQTGMNVVVMA